MITIMGYWARQIKQYGSIQMDDIDLQSPFIEEEPPTCYLYERPRRKSNPKRRILCE